MTNWESCKTNIQRNLWSLITKIDTDNGLKGEMKRHEVLSSITIRKIWEISDVVTRKSKLLDQILLSDVERFELFCKALTDSGQKHIVTMMTNPSPDSVDAVKSENSKNGESALSEEDRRKLCSKWNWVLEYMTSDPTESKFLHILANEDVFTDIQMVKLKGITSDTERNECILQFLEKTSDEKYKKFCKALTASGQSHVVKELTNMSFQSIPIGTTFQQDVDIKNTRQREENPVLTIQSSSSPHDASATKTAGNIPSTNSASVKVNDNVSFIPQRIGDQSELKEFMQRHEKEAYKIHCDIVNKTPRGFALIIANDIFDTSANMSEREGTETDIKNLKTVLDYLNFEYKIMENLSAENIRKHCNSVQRDESLKQYSVFILCVLSHGSIGTVFGTDGVSVPIEDLMTFFDGKNCIYLRDIPKLFLIQACQGDKRTFGVPVDRTDAGPDSGFDDDLSCYMDGLHLYSDPKDTTDLATKHEKADMAIVLASYPGYVAWRNVERGSYFVLCLSEVFLQNAHKEHFADMTMKVIDRMNQLEMGNGYKQVCQYRSSLAKKVYLLPY